jgi:hypothetical protein
MPAVPLIAGFALAEVGITAASVGTALLGAEVAGTAILGATTVGSVVGGTVLGAGIGAASAAIQGGDIAQGALIGGITGGVGTAVSGAVGGALGADAPLPEGMQGPIRGATLADSAALGAGAVKGISGAVTGALGSALGGGDPLRGALLGGATGGISGAAGQALGLGPMGTSALGGALGFGLSAAFPTSKETQRAGVSAQTPYQPTVSAPKAAGSSAALGNALSIAPGMGYTPSSTVFGSGESDKPKSNVWNVESLKGGAEVGPNVS